MKIGAVCEQTGLSDRTVRYYTDEGLLNPSYTKNYLGRKTFDFSEEDVALLKSIAVLHKYGFSIPEIRTILEDPAKSVEIIETLTQKKRQTIREEQELLDGLLMLEQGRAYTVPELARALNTPKLEETELPEETEDGCFIYLIKVLFWLMCAPAAVMMLVMIPWTLWEWSETFIHIKFYSLSEQPYLFSWLGTLIPVAAAAAMLTLEMKLRYKNPLLSQFLAVVLFAVYAVFGNLGFIYGVVGSAYSLCYSETEDPADYLVLGTYEEEHIPALTLLFPEEIPAYALGQEGRPSPDTTRYYNFVDMQWDSSFELFAQWQLAEADLEAEKQRIIEAFSEDTVTQEQMGSWVFWSMEGSDPVACLEEYDRYGRADSSYTYLFFAYNEETGLVRYVASYATGSKEFAGFASLKWE